MSKLDNKDLAIVKAIDKYGPKISTQSLSKILKIPSRTIRYRILKLKEKGFLKPMRISTHERKLGLGENIIILNTNQNKEKDILRLFELIPYIYNYSSTYGKFNGYLARFIFSLKDPNINLDLLKAMEEKGLISDFYIFEIIDYEIKNKNLTFYDPNKGWTWDWDEWYDTIKNSIKTKSKIFEFKTKEDSKLEDFDYKDILLLKNMFENASIKLKELKNFLNLSETQIGKRIQRLEKKEIIKAYYYDYSLIRSKDLIYFDCFFEIGEYVNNVLSCLYQLPYDFAIFIESSHKFCISLKLDAVDFKQFLKGFDLLRPLLKSYFFQFTYNQAKSSGNHLYNLYNKKNNSWETPIKDYLSLIKNE